MPAADNENNIKKTSKQTEKKEMQPEYDFTHGVRGQYASRYAEGSNVVVLDPDVSKAFPNAEAVNRTLRTLAGLAQS